MRRVLLPCACLLLLVACAQPAAAATKKERQRICAKRGVTHASSKLARVYEVDFENYRELIGCMRSNGRRLLLSSWYSCECSIGDEIPPDVELHAGRLAEVTDHVPCGPVPEPTCGGSSVSLADLRWRRFYNVQDDITEVVRRGGTFAYADGRVVLVRRRVARLVDPAGGTELALGRARLYWMRDGLPQSAPLQ